MRNVSLGVEDRLRSFLRQLSEDSIVKRNREHLLRAEIEAFGRQG